jgi:hypothetical protein
LILSLLKKCFLFWIEVAQVDEGTQRKRCCNVKNEYFLGKVELLALVINVILINKWGLRQLTMMRTYWLLRIDEGQIDLLLIRLYSFIVKIVLLM